MKKFMKSCGYTALVFFVIGMVLATVAGTIRGRTAIEDVVEQVTGGRIQLRVPFLSSWKFRTGDNDILDWVDDWEVFDYDYYDLGDDIGFDSSFPILRGNVERYSLGNDIQELDFAIGACRLTTEPSPDDNFYLEAKYTGKFQAYEADGTLYIRSTASVNRWDDLRGCRIILYIPEDAYFDRADISVGAGKLELENLYGKEISLEAGAGQLILDDLQADSLEAYVGFGQMEIKKAVVDTMYAEIGMGEFMAAAELNGDASVDCAMGNVELELKGDQRDFNFELSEALGNVTLGSISNGTFASERYVDNHADKTIDVECAMGNINIRFTE